MARATNSALYTSSEEEAGNSTQSCSPLSDQLKKGLVTICSQYDQPAWSGPFMIDLRIVDENRARRKGWPSRQPLDFNQLTQYNTTTKSSSSVVLFESRRSGRLLVAMCSREGSNHQTEDP